MTATMIRRRDGWLVTEVGGELLMMSTEHGRYVALGGVGPRIWNMLETPASKSELQRRLTEAYDVAPERCREELAAFLEDMASHDMIEFDPRPTTVG